MFFRNAVCLALVASGLVTSSLCKADDRTKKSRPDKVESYTEQKKSFKEGDKTTVTRNVKEFVEVDGKSFGVTKAVQSVVVIPQRMWYIGAEGWHDDEGFNIDGLVSFNSGGVVLPSPLSRIKTVINGRSVHVSLEANDVITKIDGVEVKTDLDLFMAVHTAANPRSLAIEFINFRDGEIMTGTISAVKLKR